MQHRHSESRHLCSQLVSIVCAAGSRIVSGNLEEIGRRSALVLADAPIHSGASVRITCGMEQLRGIVKSCSLRRPLGFFVEVDLNPDSLWWPGWFTPQHLLALFRGLAA
jgi:hypothetical protein